MTRFPKALLVLALAGVGAAASASEITVGVYSAFSMQAIRSRRTLPSPSMKASSGSTRT